MGHIIVIDMPRFNTFDLDSIKQRRLEQNLSLIILFYYDKFTSLTHVPGQVTAAGDCESQLKNHDAHGVS
jgi:hypothetical protein